MSGGQRGAVLRQLRHPRRAVRPTKPDRREEGLRRTNGDWHSMSAASKYAPQGSQACHGRVLVASASLQERRRPILGMDTHNAHNAHHKHDFDFCATQSHGHYNHAPTSHTRAVMHALETPLRHLQ